MMKHNRILLALAAVALCLNSVSFAESPPPRSEPDWPVVQNCDFADEKNDAVTTAFSCRLNAEPGDWVFADSFYQASDFFMKTRAKFVCDQVAVHRYGSETAELTAVMGGANASEENRSFNKASPNGKLSIMIDNPDAKGFFVPGKEYYLDFTPVEVVPETA